MTAQTKTYASALGTFFVLATTAYLIGVKQRAAVPESANYQGEQIEVHSYPIFTVPGPRDSVRAFLKDLQWRLTHRGHTRILTAAARAEKKAPNGLLTPQ